MIDLRLGDCREVMVTMEPESVDAIVTDPPYGLEFMGKEWDRLGGGFSESKGDGTWAAKHNTTRKGFDGYGPMPNYVTPTANQRCPDCGNWRDGRDPSKPDKRKGYRCICGGAQREQRRAVARGMQDWHEGWAREALRVLKPGGHMLAFGGTRTHHRLMVAIEDAGFEIRDCLMWLYGTGFPKSQSVSRAHDRALGKEIGDEPSDFAKEWSGWGTALKPGWEPIVLARKPLAGTVAANVARYGTGALNIDGCRVEAVGGLTSGGRPTGTSNPCYMSKDVDPRTERTPEHALGRWPANVALDEDAAGLLDATVGERKGPGGPARTGSASAWPGGAYQGAIYPNETGGPSRFFYVAKASSSERNAGLGGMPLVAHSIGDERPSGGMHERYGDANGSGRSALARNPHPTVKPITLMRYLCRLITPPGGLILDPFMGSGSTGCAAVMEGFSFFGIDQEEENIPLSEARINYWQQQCPPALKFGG